MDDAAAPPMGPDAPRAPDRPVTGRPPVPRGVLWGLALVVVVLTVASWVALSNPSVSDAGSAGEDGHAGHLPTTDLTGRPAPDADFTLLDGTPTSLAALRGHPVVLNFWSRNCGPCVTEMPAFEQVHQAYGDQVSFVGLAVADSEASARDQQERTGVTYPLGLDPEYRIARAFGIVAIPATVLIDGDGTIVHATQGPALTAPELTGLITEKLQA